MSHRILLGMACLLVAVAAWAATPEGNNAGSGTISAAGNSLTLRWRAPVGAGALIACRARVVPLGPGASARAYDASVVVPGGAEQCALEIPLDWRGSAPPASINVIYELDVRSASGTVARTGVQTIVLPHAIGSWQQPMGRR